MPIKVESVTNPTEQDWIDLQKIYLDLPHKAESATDMSGFQAEIKARFDNGEALFAARFNDRLIASCWIIQVSESEPRQISNFCVRKVTRRRGVGQQFLQFLLKQLSDSELTIDTKPSQQESGLHHLLSNIGFTALEDQEGIWHINL